MSGGKAKVDPYYEKDPPKAKSAKKSRNTDNVYTPEVREKMRQKALARWRTPEFRAKMAKAFRSRTYTEEGRKNISEKRKQMWTDPEYRRVISAGLKRAMQDPSQRSVRSEKCKEAWANPDLRKRQRQRMQKQWKDGKYREKVLEGVRKAVKDPDWIRRHSEALKRRWKDPEFREFQDRIKRRKAAETAEKRKLKPRPSRRTPIQRLYDRVRKRDRKRCRSCGKLPPEGENHHVHHMVPRIEGGPDEEWNLVTVDRSCHRKAEAQSDWLKIPLKRDGTPVVAPEEVLKHWWNYYHGEPT